MTGKRVVIFPNVNGRALRGFCGDEIIGVDYQTRWGLGLELQVTLRRDDAKYWEEAALLDLVGTKLHVSVDAGTITSLCYGAGDPPNCWNEHLWLAGTFFESYYPRSIAGLEICDLTFGGGTPLWERPSAKQVKQ